MTTLGHMVEVPVTLVIAVRGSQTNEQALAAAREFFVTELERIADDNGVGGWQVQGVKISEVSLELSENGEGQILDTLLQTDNGEVWSEDLLPLNREGF